MLRIGAGAGRGRTAVVRGMTTVVVVRHRRALVAPSVTRTTGWGVLY